MSIIWSTNTGYAIYGVFSILFLYIIYKVFEIATCEENKEKLLTNILIVCLCLTITVKFLSIISIFHNIDKIELDILLLMLLPFYMFSTLKYAKIVSPALLIIVITTLYFSGSYRLMVTSIFLGLTYLLFKTYISLKIKYISIIAIFSFILGITVIFNILHEGTHSSTLRLKIWENSLALIQESPIIGYGKNNWEIEYARFFHTSPNSQFSPTSYRSAHNSIIQILTELGFVGILIYTFTFLSPFYSLIKKSKLITNLEISCMVSVVLYFLLSLTFSNTLNIYEQFNTPPLLAVILLGILSRKTNKSVKVYFINKKYFIKTSLIVSIVIMTFFGLIYRKNNLFKESRVYFNKEKYLKANLLTNSSYILIKDTNFSKLMANTQHSLGETEMAIKTLETALIEDPYNLQLNFTLAQLNFDKGKHIEAYDLSKSIMKRDLHFLPNKILNIKSEYLLFNNRNSLNKLEEIEGILINQYDKIQDRKKTVEYTNSNSLKGIEKLILSLIEDIRAFINKSSY